MSDFEQCSDRLQLDLILILVNFSCEFGQIGETFDHGGEGRRLCCGQMTWFCSVVGRQRLCFAHAAWQKPKQTLQFQ